MPGQAWQLTKLGVTLVAIVILATGWTGCGDSSETSTVDTNAGNDASERTAADPTPTDCGDLYLQRMERQLDKYPQSDPRVAKLREGNREIAREACENNERASLGERPETWECAALEAK
jgi:hypothetical protein